MSASKYEITDFGTDIVFTTRLPGRFWTKKQSTASLREWSKEHGSNASVILAEINLLRDMFGDQIEDCERGIKISHSCLAKLSSNSLDFLGLPKNPSSKFLLSLRGSISTEDFDLKYKWQNLSDTRERGAFLQTSSDDFVIPDPVFSIIKLIKEFRQKKAIDPNSRWELISKVINLIDNRKAVGVDFSEVSRRQIAELQGALREIKIKTASALSLDVKRNASGVSFVPVLFGEQNEDVKQQLSETDGLLTELERVSFENGNQSFTYFENAKKTYVLNSGEYILIEDNLFSALELVRKKQKAPPEEREEFARNPGKAFTEHFERVLQTSQTNKRKELVEELELDNEEKIEKLIESTFFETKEFSERVIEIGLWKPPVLPYVEKVDNQWVPETFGIKIGEVYVPLPTEDVLPLIEKIKKAIKAGLKSIEWNEVEIAADDHTVEILEQLDGLIKPDPPEAPKDKVGPLQKHVLIVRENFEKLTYVQDYSPRKTEHKKLLSKNITTALKLHQTESFNWMVECYLHGVPGILNADDQGLGKTLQSIAFMAWLQEHQKIPLGQSFRPILVVAPTSLLRNWQSEVDLHMDAEKLGSRIEAYGSKLKEFRGQLKGIDTDDASLESRLDFSRVLGSGKRSPTWILTTYKTLTNYAQSFAKISFSAVIFDEIQNIKNPGTLQNNAANNLKADFKIGLTGTPVENALSDLWSIMDTLVPGYLSSLKQFNQHFGKAEPQLLKELYDKIFKAGVNCADGKKLPPLGIRRMKSEAAADLPLKRYEKYPIDMFGLQAASYDQMIDQLHKLKLEGGVSPFKTINYLRSLSLHPEKLELAYKEKNGIAAFLQKSARILQAIEILKSIQKKREKALVFLETIEMQYLLQEFFRDFFALDKVDIINGDVSVPRRAEIVKNFQDKKNDNEFALLILGPKSAGVGLTLTAATHVIHLSRWWNPAVEEQCNDRVYRIGQEKDVTIHLPLAVHPQYKHTSFDCILNNIMHRKRELFQSVLMPPTRSNDEEAQGIWSEMIMGDENFLPIIDGKTGVQFENWISETAKQKGPWRSSKTNKTGDGGADVILKHSERNNETVIIQAKHTSNPQQNLSKAAIEEVLKSQNFYPNLKNSHFLVITNYANFSQPAKELAKQHNVKLVARDNLCLWPNHII